LVFYEEIEVPVAGVSYVLKTEKEKEKTREGKKETEHRKTKGMVGKLYGRNFRDLGNLVLLVKK
jgi:hypothetical protein